MTLCWFNADQVCVSCGKPATHIKQRRSCAGQVVRSEVPHKHRASCLAGTALKSLLASIGITAAPNCSCNARAAEMDARGCDWCEQNIDTIVGWLREEATKRGLPFLDAAGRLLVRRAISNARKQAKMKQ